MESKYGNTIFGKNVDSSVFQKFELRTKKRYEWIQKKIISEIKEVDINGGQNHYDFFKKIFDDNPNPGFTEEDLKDPNFCERNENNFVLKIFDEIMPVVDLGQMMEKYFISSEIKIDDGDGLYINPEVIRICKYFDFKIRWEKIGDQYLIMTNKYVQLKWVTPHNLYDMINCSLQLFFEDVGIICEIILGRNSDILVNYNNTDIKHKKDFRFGSDGYLRTFSETKNNVETLVRYNERKRGQIDNIFERNIGTRENYREIYNRRKRTKEKFHTIAGRRFPL